MRFYNRLKGLVPILKTEKQFGKGLSIISKISFANAYEKKWANSGLTYISEVEGFAERMDKDSVLLVSDDKAVALKAAVHLINTVHYLDSDYDFYELCDGEMGCLDEMAPEIVLIDFTESYKCAENERKQYGVLPASLSGTENVVYIGLEDGIDLEEKVDCIRASAAQCKMICITPKQLKENCIIRWRAEEAVKVLKLPGLSQTYYEDLINYLLKAEKMKLGKGVTTKLLLHSLKNKFGNELNEELIAWELDEADRKSREIQIGKNDSPQEQAKKVNHAIQNNILNAKDFENLELGKVDAITRLESMVGLHVVKRMVTEYSALLQETLRNPALGKLHHNMLLYGNPGTGKTTTASMIAELLAESGTGNPILITATRSDIIGKYVGHTAPKISKLFTAAIGGVLFVDEAGFFLNKNAGGFVEEAVKEFVRFMEMYPDVTVVFALYEREVKDFLNLDEGLTSRISRIVHFEDYSNEELISIMRTMLSEKGYEMSETCDTLLDKYFTDHRKQNNFGNARDARKLVESTIISVSLRHMSTKSEDRCVTESDIATAITRLKNEISIEDKRFGFDSNSMADKDEKCVNNVKTCA